MGVELCKSVTLNEKKNIVKVTTASSNLRPFSYGSWEYQADTFQDKLLLLFYDILNGNVHISVINKNTEKIEYAHIRVKEYAELHNIDTYELYKTCREKYQTLCDNNKENADKLNRMIAMRETYKELFEIFSIELLNSYETDLYYVTYDGGTLCKLSNYYSNCSRGYSKFSYGFRGSRSIQMSYYQAYIVCYCFDNYHLQMEKIQIA